MASGTAIIISFQMALFILRPTMFTLVMLSMGTYTVKPFFPGCAEVPDLPVKLVTIATMRMYSSLLCSEL